jgi:hypothetical protein
MLDRIIQSAHTSSNITTTTTTHSQIQDKKWNNKQNLPIKPYKAIKQHLIQGKESNVM